jgi:hypothetical protein
MPLELPIFELSAMENVAEDSIAMKNAADILGYLLRLGEMMGCG